MFYPSTAGSVTSFVQPMQPGYAMQPQPYYPAAPMSAVMPGQHYYPHMHAPLGQGVMYPPRTAYGYGMQPAMQMPYYGQQPTVIVSSRSGRHGHHHRHHSRSRSRGFLGYL